MASVHRWWCFRLMLLRPTRRSPSIGAKFLITAVIVCTNLFLLKLLLISHSGYERSETIVHSTSWNVGRIMVPMAPSSVFDWNARIESRIPFGMSGHVWHFENANRQWKLVKNSKQIVEFHDRHQTLFREKRSDLANDHDDDDNDNSVHTANRFTEAASDTKFMVGRPSSPPVNYLRHHRRHRPTNHHLQQQGANHPLNEITVNNGDGGGGGAASDGLDIALSYGPLLGLNCSAFADLSSVQFVSGGWTKAVYKAKYNKKEDVAIKEVNLYGHDMSACLKQTGVTFWDCYKKCAAKILKEIVLLNEIGHPNLLKVLGYCIPDGEPVIKENVVGSGISMITELGEPLDIIRLLQSSWEDRLRISLGVCRLIYHLAHSPLGTLIMNDFRRQQFVLVDGELKLSDVDDMELEEPPCTNNEQCTIRHEIAELVLPVSCVRRRCEGFNEKQNIYNAGRHFVSFLLPHGAPPTLRPLIAEIATAFSNVSWDTGRLLDAMENVKELFISGKYLYRDSSVNIKKDYHRLENSDLPGLYDYRCHLTLSGNGCTMSIFDEQEGMEICNEDPVCNAFVITSQTSWTGRRIAHFKSNFSAPTIKERSMLYVKIT